MIGCRFVGGRESLPSRPTPPARTGNSAGLNERLCSYGQPAHTTASIVSMRPKADCKCRENRGYPANLGCTHPPVIHPSLRGYYSCKSLAPAYLADVTQQDAVAKTLRARGLRITAARRAVFSVLEASPSPMATSQVIQQLEHNGESLDPVTVYRTLASLERCDLVMRIDRMKEGWRYALRARSHSHTIVCAACGRTAAMEHCELERLERALERSTGFINVRHALQFSGICPMCAAGHAVQD